MIKCCLSYSLKGEARPFSECSLVKIADFRSMWLLDNVRNVYWLKGVIAPFLSLAAFPDQNDLRGVFWRLQLMKWKTQFIRIKDNSTFQSLSKYLNRLAFLTFSSWVLSLCVTFCVGLKAPNSVCLMSLASLIISEVISPAMEHELW